MDALRHLSRKFRPNTDATVILELDLDLGVTTQPPANVAAAVRAMNVPAMRSLLAGLRRGAADPGVAGLIIHVGTCPFTPTQLDELAAAVEDFRRSKPVIAYTESFGELGNSTLAYRFATSADSIWVQPSGEVGLPGVALSVSLWRGTLDKVGVEPQFGQRHEYKTAADRFMAHEVTDANREMLQRIADSIVEDTVEIVAARRGLSAEDVRALVDGPPVSAHDAMERGLIDYVGYRDEVYDAAREQWGSDAELRYVHRVRPTSSSPMRCLTDRKRPAVAVVGVHGPIVAGRPRQGLGEAPATSEVVGMHLRRAVADPDVRAIVLRVDSPGGSYIASDAIRREVIQARRSGKPVIASMGSVAASGGYFVSMAADEIVASATTLTGSIGVLAGKMVIDGLTRRIGLVREDIASGPWATMMSAASAFTSEQWDALNQRLDEIYDDFTAKAATDRGMDVEQLRAVARGRVWTGHDALRHNLIDQLGGAELAIQRACALAGLDRGKTSVQNSPRMQLWDRIRPAESSESANAPGANAATVRDLLSGGPDSIVEAVASAAGWAPAGVLTVPWNIAIR